MTAKRSLVPALLTAALLALGGVLIAPRSYDAIDPVMRIRGDAVSYIEIAGGVPLGQVMVPFRYRVLVPKLASVLPLEPHIAIATVSMGFLALTVWLLFHLGRRLGYSPADAAVGIVCIFCGPAILYGFHNPFLTDTVGLFMTSVALLALLERRPALFALATTVGVLGRESVGFVMPAYVGTLLLTKTWRPRESPGLLAAGVVLPVLAFLTPRLLPGIDSHGLKSYGALYYDLLLRTDPFLHPVHVAVSLYVAWGWVWIVGSAGLLLWYRKSREAAASEDARWRSVAVAVSFALLTTGGVGVLVAVGGLDSGRLLLVAAPVLTVATMEATARLRDRCGARRAMSLLAAAVIVALGVSLIEVPNRVLTTSQRWALPLWLPMLAGVMLAGVVARVVLTSSRRLEVDAR